MENVNVGYRVVKDCKTCLWTSSFDEALAAFGSLTSEFPDLIIAIQYIPLDYGED